MYSYKIILDEQSKFGKISGNLKKYDVIFNNKVILDNIYEVIFDNLK